MLSFGGKKCKNAFFGGNPSLTNFQPIHSVRVNSVVHKTEKHSKSWNFWGDRFSYEFHKKSHFPKIDCRFWKSYEASSWDQWCVFFGRRPQGYTLQSKFSRFCNRKFSPISHTSTWSANVWNFNYTISVREKYSGNTKLTNALEILLQSDKKWNLQTGTKVIVLKALFVCNGKTPVHFFVQLCRQNDHWVRYFQSFQFFWIMNKGFW